MFVLLNYCIYKVLIRICMYSVDVPSCSFFIRSVKVMFSSSYALCSAAYMHSVLLVLLCVAINVFYLVAGL